tara:strand:- start:871 stop:1380 length:510 start_codon:yes stop_codon:yes gene_type:complete
MALLNPAHLLEQADQLVAPAAGGAPRQADLRRAISNAYYAVFHTVISQAADDFIGKAQRQNPRYALVYRSIDHRSLRELCKDIQKPTPPAKLKPYIPKFGLGSDLTALGAAVIDLQEKRLSADYDPLYRVRLSDASLAVATARTAIERFELANRAMRKVFLSLLAFSPR